MLKRPVATLLLVLLPSLLVWGFVPSEEIWETGETEFRTQFFNFGVTPSPSAKFKTAFEEALQIWTDQSSFVFTANTSATANPCSEDVEAPNSIAFDTDACGSGYGPATLAIQSSFFVSSPGGFERKRSVITFNSGVNWDVFNGSQSGFTDFRRVAVHELGHSIGLDHEDSGVPAIMRSIVSAIEQPTADDLAGVAFMYDRDNDGTGFADDNCPVDANANQADQDNDDIGDVCDPDIDGDTIANAALEDQSFAKQNISGVFFPFGSQANGSFFAQSFTPGFSGQLTAIQLPVSCSAGNLTVRIENVDGNQRPNGVVLDSVTIAGGPDTFVNGLATIDLTGNNGTAALTQGTTVAIRLSSNGSCAWQTAESGSYGGGVASFSNNGNSWFSLGSGNPDLPFVTFSLPNVLDNCPFVSNQGQQDSNSDGVGDACDADADGADDAIDNCPGLSNPSQEDLDGDGLGNDCDSDKDGDGVEPPADEDDLNGRACSDTDSDGCDDCSSGQFDTDNDGLDTDGNGICNVSDTDDDNDGVLDGEDNCPLIDNPLQEDSDDNGVGDVCDGFCFVGVAKSGAVFSACL